MTPNEYQTACLRTWARRDDDAEASNAALGLAGEVGEVVEIVKKDLYHSKPADMEKLRAELGDCGYYLAVLCHVYGLTLGDVFAANIAKLRARHPDGWSPGYHHQRQN